jgi:hypothetical protein
VLACSVRLASESVQSQESEGRCMSEFADILIHAAAYALALFFGSVAGMLCFDKD